MQPGTLGATGGTGGCLPNWALDAGTPVHAPPPATRRRCAGGLTITRGGALDADTDGVGEAVSSTVAAMEKIGARWLICVSAAGASITSDPHRQWLITMITPFRRPGVAAVCRALAACSSERPKPGSFTASCGLAGYARGRPRDAAAT